MGLIDKLRKANTAKELDTLIEQAATFEFATDATKRRWARTYKARKHELTSTKTDKSG